MIIRPQYMNILKTYRDVSLVKILLGIRRCGKSTILDMLRDDLQQSGIAADHIISMCYTSEEFDDGMTDKDMYNGIKEQMTDAGRYYLLLDEVQEIDGWEKAVNSLLENANTDIYVTGSNSKLMSSEISTYLTGRYISIPVYTLSFAEYLDFKNSILVPRGSCLTNICAWVVFRLWRWAILMNALLIKLWRESITLLFLTILPSDIILRTLIYSTVL